MVRAKTNQSLLFYCLSLTTNKSKPININRPLIAYQFFPIYLPIGLKSEAKNNFLGICCAVANLYLDKSLNEESTKLMSLS